MDEGVKSFSHGTWPMFVIGLFGFAIGAAIEIAKWAFLKLPFPANLPWAVAQIALGLGLVLVVSVIFSRLPQIGTNAHGLWGWSFLFFRRVEIGWDELTVQPILRLFGIRLVRLRSSKTTKSLIMLLPLRDMAGFRAVAEQFAPGNEQVAVLIGGK